jgi:nucleotide-binding universal stress UspA family protein
MKTLLIPTDFSPNAKHAVEYGYKLAKQIKANVILCNAVIVPAEIPQAGFIAWPMEEYDVLIDESAEELKKLKADLKHDEDAFTPLISCFNEVGATADVVNGLIAKKNIDLVVMGTHRNSGLSSFLLGNHTRILIDTITKPLLLVPPKTPVTPIKKIAFAADFKQPEKDLGSVYALIPLAKALNAEILITHVYDGKDQSPEFHKWITNFLTDLSNKADYPHIYYRLVRNDYAEEGLDWLCNHGQIDMLAMIHRPHTFFDSILKGSYTQKMASHITIPLLVFPGRG